MLQVSLPSSSSLPSLLLASPFGQKRGLLLPWVDIESADTSLTHLQHENGQLIEAAKQAHQNLATLRTAQNSEQQISSAQEHLEAVTTRLRAVQWQIRVLQSEPRQHLAR